MSIRTVIEINHDYLRKLKDDPQWAQKLYDCLATHGWKGERSEFPPPDGARVLVDRHHSDSLYIGFNGVDARDFS